MINWIHIYIHKNVIIQSAADDIIFLSWRHIILSRPEQTDKQMHQIFVYLPLVLHRKCYRIFIRKKKYQSNDRLNKISKYSSCVPNSRSIDKCGIGIFISFNFFVYCRVGAVCYAYLLCTFVTKLSFYIHTFIDRTMKT